MNQIRSTNLILIHLGADGQIVKKTSHENYYRHYVPSGSFPLVATLMDQLTRHTIEYRSYNGVTYREEPTRSREALGGTTYLRVPEDEANYLAELTVFAKPTEETLVYAGRLWQRDKVPTYRVAVGENQVELSASTAAHDGPRFNALQKDEAVEYALAVGQMLSLPFVQTHILELHDPNYAGPAASTSDGSSAAITYRQRAEQLLSELRSLSRGTPDLELIDGLDRISHCLDILRSDIREAIESEHAIGIATVNYRAHGLLTNIPGHTA